MILVLWGSYFLAYIDYFKGTKHVDMTARKEYLFQIINTIINLNNYLKDDLPNALSYIRVSLDSIKKKDLKQIADHVNDFLNDQNSQFFYNQWYLMALISL